MEVVSYVFHPHTIFGCCSKGHNGGPEVLLHDCVLHVKRG